LSQEIHTKAEPFIKWLKEAEEEDDTDSVEEDAEDDLEIEYDDRAKASPLKEQPKQIANKKPVDDDDDDDNVDGEDDLDIDAI